MSAKGYYESEYYVQGNTVRKRQTANGTGSRAYAREREAARAVRRERLEAAPDRRREYDRKRQGKPMARTMPAQAWDFKSLLFIAAAVTVTFLMCISYLQAQESITAMSKEVASLENEIMTLKNQNDAECSRIGSYTDLSYVYDVAVNELGMVHAKDNQVIPYRNTKSNSVRQYGEIPEKTDDLPD